MDYHGDFLVPTDTPKQKLYGVILEIISQYNDDPHYLLPALNALQQEFGYLSSYALYLTSVHFRLPLGKVYSIATFAKQFKFNPHGKYIIEVCNGVGCTVKGGADILAVLEAELGIKAGQTTKDNLFTLHTVACLGACALAPALKINGHTYSELKPKDVLRIIKEYELKADSVDF